VFGQVVAIKQGATQLQRAIPTVADDVQCGDVLSALQHLGDLCGAVAATLKPVDLKRAAAILLRDDGGDQVLRVLDAAVHEDEFDGLGHDLCRCQNLCIARVRGCIAGRCPGIGQYLDLRRAGWLALRAGLRVKPGQGGRVGIEEQARFQLLKQAREARKATGAAFALHAVFSSARRGVSLTTQGIMDAISSGHSEVASPRRHEAPYILLPASPPQLGISVEKARFSTRISTKAGGGNVVARHWCRLRRFGLRPNLHWVDPDMACPLA